MIKYIAIIIVIVAGILLFNNKDLFLSKNETSLANVSNANNFTIGEDFVLSEIPKPKLSAENSSTKTNTSTSSLPLNGSAFTGATYSVEVNHYHEGKWWYKQNYIYPFTGNNTFTYTVKTNDSKFVKFNRYEKCPRVSSNFSGNYCNIFPNGPGSKYSFDVYWDSKVITVKTDIKIKIPNSWTMADINPDAIPKVLVNGKVLPSRAIPGSNPYVDNYARVGKFKAGTKLTFKQVPSLAIHMRFQRWSGACSNTGWTCIIKAEDAIKDITVVANHEARNRLDW